MPLRALFLVISTLGTLMCLAQEHYTAVVGFKPWNSPSGVQSSNTEPPWLHVNFDTDMGPELFLQLFGLLGVVQLIFFCFRFSVLLFDAPGVSMCSNKLFISSHHLCFIIVLRSKYLNLTRKK